jgi:hypothetical protein
MRVMDYDFKPGDRVKLAFGFHNHSGAGTYEIIRVLPAGVDAEKQYRVRGDDGVERAIGEKQIRTLADERPGFVR